MKIALLSDIHGNLPAFQAVLDDLQDFCPDLFVVAGDLTGIYANEVLHLLRKLGAVMIVGNSDLTVLRYIRNEAPQEWRTHKQFGMVRWNARHLSEENFQFLTTLPEQRVIHLPGTAPIRVVHGSPRSPSESIYPEKNPALLALAFGMMDEPVLVCGHTHEPWCLYQDGKLAVNPGAVAGPLNGQTGAQYARLEWNDHHWQVTLKCIPYDLDLVKDAFIRGGMLAEAGPIARGFLLSMQTGRDLTLHFLKFAYGLAEQAGYINCKALPDEIWEKAEAEFPWENWG